jgi:hypothetical protein
MEVVIFTFGRSFFESIPLKRALGQIEFAHVFLFVVRIDDEFVDDELRVFGEGDLRVVDQEDEKLGIVARLQCAVHVDRIIDTEFLAVAFGRGKRLAFDSGNGADGIKFAVLRARLRREDQNAAQKGQ